MQRQHPRSFAVETHPLTGRTLDGRYLVHGVSSVGESVVQLVGQDTETGGAINIDVVREGARRAGLAARGLEREAMSTARIRHPNVLGPRHLGVLDDGTPYVVTTRFIGGTLEDQICVMGRLPVRDVVRVGIEVLSALAAAHAVGVVHGSLRPASIFLVDRPQLESHVLVTGFDGVAASRSAPLGFANVAFVAPEVVVNATPSIAADLFAVGAILYLAATGLPPYNAGSAWTFRPELPAQLVRVLTKALQPRPSRRYEDALHMLEALGAVSDLPEPEPPSEEPHTSDPVTIRVALESGVLPTLRMDDSQQSARRREHLAFAPTVIAHDFGAGLIRARLSRGAIAC